mgnify:CR=1 FL=1
MQPSEKQQKIYDTWQNEDCNILVQAVAGSGKRRNATASERS